MFPNSITTGDELRASARLPVFLPGESEPAWLQHRLDYAAGGEAPGAGQPVADPCRQGLGTRLRAAFGLL
jgi:hypothetical protein